MYIRENFSPPGQHKLNILPSIKVFYSTKTSTVHIVAYIKYFT